MNRERWQQVEHLYHQALEREPRTRRAFLAAACTDESLCREVESLLDEDSTVGLLDQPAWQAGASLLIDHRAQPLLEAFHTGEGRFPAGTLLAGRYRIVAPLGRGGMGEVYRATDLKLATTVALKFLPEPVADDSTAVNRLYNEVRLARQISHPNVCRVHDVVEADGLRFLTMEYIDGEDLRSLLQRIGRLPNKKATEIARGLCSGLAAAHQQGVLHRDLKPANIMIDRQGNVRITDFGLAVLSGRLSATELRSGTPAYMSPEQLAGEAVSTRSDVYALGLVLYELFSGHAAFENANRRSEPPAPLQTDVDPEIERTILRCLDFDPRGRPPSAAAVAVELWGADALAAVLAAGETPGPELVARSGDRQGLTTRAAAWCLSALVACLLVFGFVAPRASVLSRVTVERSEALERVARDTLAGLGIRENGRHRVGRFAFDTAALRRHLAAAAMYFWYRSSQDWMIPSGLSSVVSRTDPPVEQPGAVTTKWDSTGRLLYLKAVPSQVVAGATNTPKDVWSGLFAAAGLPLSGFQPAEPGWISAPAWDARGTWTGTYSDAGSTPVRVEAASWRGQPVYFEVIPAWRDTEASSPPNSSARLSAMQFAVFLIVLTATGVLAWRNVALARGDRRGAFRIAVFVFIARLLAFAFAADHVPDVLEFTLLFRAVLWAGFWAVYLWTLYMGLEPYVRRRWPHALIPWSRMLSGKFRDPMVGRHLLIGLTFGAAISVFTAVATFQAGTNGVRLPALWILSAPSTSVAYAAGYAVDACVRGLFLLFVALLFKLLFRRELFVIAGVTSVVLAVSAVFDAAMTPLSALPFTLMFLPAATALVFVLIRTGLLAAVFGIYVYELLPALPFTTDISAPSNTACIFVLCGFAALGFFAYRSTLSRKPFLNFQF